MVSPGVMTLFVNKVMLSQQNMIPTQTRASSKHWDIVVELIIA
jgi:hypothetical protein